MNESVKHAAAMSVRSRLCTHRYSHLGTCTHRGIRCAVSHVFQRPFSPHMLQHNVFSSLFFFFPGKFSRQSALHEVGNRPFRLFFGQTARRRLCQAAAAALCTDQRQVTSTVHNQGPEHKQQPCTMSFIPNITLAGGKRCSTSLNSPG